MPRASDANRTLASIAARAFGGKPNVRRFWDDDHKSHVDILDCKNRPQEGVCSYSTLGLSDCPLYLHDDEYGVRIELVGACADTFTGFDNALATAAFCIINSKWFCAPGVVFPDILSMYKCSATMKHFFFVPPFLWDEGLKTINLKTKKVAWLLAVPISDAERKLADSKGTESLEDIFVERQIDIFDLHRPSVL